MAEPPKPAVEEQGEEAASLAHLDQDTPSLLDVALGNMEKEGKVLVGELPDPNTINQLTTPHAAALTLAPARILVSGSALIELPDRVSHAVRPAVNRPGTFTSPSCRGGADSFGRRHDRAAGPHSAVPSRRRRRDGEVHERPRAAHGHPFRLHVRAVPGARHFPKQRHWLPALPAQHSPSCRVGLRWARALVSAAAAGLAWTHRVQSVSY